MKISDIKIGSNRRLISQAKVNEIADSIRQIGLLNPIVVNKSGYLIAGLHRLEAFKLLGKTDIPATEVSLDDLNSELAEIDENLIRNELSVLERGDQLARRKEIYEELYPETKAGKSQALAMNRTRRKEIYEELYPETKAGKSQALAMNRTIGNNVKAESAPTFITDTAQKTGRSETVIKEEIRIAKNITPEAKAEISQTPFANNKTVLKAIASIPENEQKEIIAKGEKEIIAKAKEIQSAKREVKRAEVIAKLESIENKEVKALQGVFDVIVIDPPWPMKKIDRDVTPNQVEFEYPTIELDEIKAIKIPAAVNCHMWLWTTQKFLPDALDCLKAWDFKYVCAFVWHKNGGFQPFNLPQYNCEFALYARKGTPEFTDTKALNTCFNADRTKHSEKPEFFYDMVRRVTAGRRADMFNRRQIDGFETWGKEAANG